MAEAFCHFYHAFLSFQSRTMLEVPNEEQGRRKSENVLITAQRLTERHDCNVRKEHYFFGLFTCVH